MTTRHDVLVYNLGAGAWQTVLPTGGSNYATYTRVPLDDLPSIPPHLCQSLGWLARLEAANPGLGGSAEAERSFGPDFLPWIEGQGLPGRLVPEAFAAIAADPSLLHGIRSPTGCFVDLGAKVVPVAVEGSGGWLVRLLSDSQMSMSWLLEVDAVGEHRIVATPAVLGYDWPQDPDEPYPIPAGALNPSDLAALEVEPCARSLTEFLARLWLEGETWWSLHGDPSHIAEVQEYERTWRERFM